MDFLILRPLSPKTGYHFFEGGAGGGSKVFAEKPPSNGRQVFHIRLRSNGNAPGRRFLGRLFESWSVDAGRGAAAVLAAPGFEPLAKKSVAACITIRPLPGLDPIVLPTAWTRVCH